MASTDEHGAYVDDLPPANSFIPRAVEPDPVSDDDLALIYGLETLRLQIKRAIQRGVVNPQELVKRFLDYDDARFNKSTISKVVTEVYQEIIESIRSLDVRIEEVKYLLQNDLLLEELNNELDGHLSTKDKVSVVTAIGALSKDRIGFLKFVGAFTGKKDDDSPHLAGNPPKQLSASYEVLRDDADAFDKTHAPFGSGK